MARGAMSAQERKLWQEYAKSKMSPVDLAKQKLRAASKRAMSRRNVKARRDQIRLIDATQYGTTFAVPFYPDRNKGATMLMCSYRLRGDDLEVTIPIHIKSWKDWPAPGPALSRMKRVHRRGTHAACLEAFRKLNFVVMDGGVPGLKHCLDAIGCVRIGEWHDPDSALHELHHVRDGGHDVYAGMTLDKNGEPVWHGQFEDHENRKRDPDCVMCQYNQIDIEDYSGIRIVFRFKPGMAPKVTV